MALVSVKDFGSALGISGSTIRSKKSRNQLCCNSKGLIDTENPINYIYLLEVNGGNQDVFIPFDIKPINKANVQRKVTTPTIGIIKKPKESVVEDETSEQLPNSETEKPSEIKGSVKVAPTVETNKIPKEKEVQVAKKLTTEERKQRADEKKQKEASREYNETLLDIEIRKKKADLRLIERNAEIKEAQLEKIAGNTVPLDLMMSLIAINFKAIFKSFHSQSKNMASTMVQRLGGTNDDLNEIMKEIEKTLDYVRVKSKEKSQMDVDRLVEEYSEVRSRGERK